jgi:hypothetical protein
MISGTGKKKYRFMPDQDLVRTKTQKPLFVLPGITGGLMAWIRLIQQKPQ